jgi:hypothetical protein
MDDLLPNSYCSEVNCRLSELHFLVWLAQQKKEERRLVIATLQALVGSSPTSKRFDSEDLVYGPHAEGSSDENHQLASSGSNYRPPAEL